MPKKKTKAVKPSIENKFADKDTRFYTVYDKRGKLIKSK